jgi:hypothetical protein
MKLRKYFTHAYSQVSVPTTPEQPQRRWPQASEIAKGICVKLARSTLHAFGTSTRLRAPRAAILCDKFHVLRRFGKALDTISKREYYRVQGKPRTFIKGQKYTQTKSG